jgi:ethanolamine ammonia-lyase small subunit
VLGQGCDLGTELAVSIGDTGIAELNIITLLASDLDLVVTRTDLGLKVENDSLEVLRADSLSILLSQKNETVLVPSFKVALTD